MADNPDQSTPGSSRKRRAAVRRKSPPDGGHTGSWQIEYRVEFVRPHGSPLTPEDEAWLRQKVVALHVWAILERRRMEAEQEGGLR